MQSQVITNQTQAQISHNQNQTIGRLEFQIEQLAASVRERERKDIFLIKLCPTREDNMLLKIFHRPVRNWF